MSLDGYDRYVKVTYAKMQERAASKRGRRKAMCSIFLIINDVPGVQDVVRE